MFIHRDLEKAMTFFAADCVYEDMIYAKPFEVRGHTAGTARRRRLHGGEFRPASRRPAQ